MKMNRTGLTVIAISAAFFAGSIVTMASGGVGAQSSKKKAKRGPAGPAGAVGPAGPAGAQGAAGKDSDPVIYAKVETGGDVTDSFSKGITDAMVTKTAGNAYCFNGLPFTPKSVEVTGVYADTPFTLGRVITDVGGTTGDCVTAGDQATVKWFDTDNIGTGTPTATGFYVVFRP